jgi:hypothetical protein
MGNFDLNIEMGDDAMQTGDDVADALEFVATRLREGYTSGLIVDVNGNRVGVYKFTEA